jgi:hypothetical protein
MGQLTQKDLRTPHNGETSRKIRARIDKITSRQAVAATLTDTFTASVAGTVQEIGFVGNVLAGAGESMTIDVTINGVSCLSTPLVINNTRAARTLHLASLAPAARNVPFGAQIIVTRTYVAGGTPAPIGSSVIDVEIG